MNEQLAFQNVHRAYVRGKDVLHGVSFALEPGEVVGLLGLARGDPGSGLDGGSIFVLLWLLLNASFGVAASRLHMLDPLPLPRRRVFAYVALPGLLVVALGYVGAMALRTRWESRSLLVDYRRHSATGEVDVCVPLAFWEIGWEGQPPPVGAPYVPPWEEPHYPWSTALFRGGSVVLYSPYHVPEGSPTGVVAEAVSRAVEDVYGARIPAEEIERRYLVAGTDGGTVVRGGGLTLLRDEPDLRPTLWLRVAPVGVLLVSLPWLLFLAATVRGGYLRPSGDRRPWAPLLFTGLLALCLLVVLWSYSAGHTTAWKLAALVQILLRKASEALPGGPLAWWGGVILLDAGGYLLARARFARTEVPATTWG